MISILAQLKQLFCVPRPGSGGRAARTMVARPTSAVIRRDGAAPARRPEPRRGTRTCVLLALATLHGPVVAQTDDVAAYLESHNLPQLLIVHLEDALEDATGEEQQQIVLRLADLYAEQLLLVEDPAERISLEQRARRLLAEVPPEDADELRLAILRAQYRPVERTAEQYRLRLATDEAVDEAIDKLREILPQMEQLQRRAAEVRETAERRMGRAVGREAARFGDRANDAGQLEQQTIYLRAWALYYASLLTDDINHARLAATLFGPLLVDEARRPEPEDVSVDRRELESYARTILGMALSQSRSASLTTALSWIILLEHPQTNDGMRRQQHVWHSVILLEHREFADALDLLEQRLDDAPDPSWLRLLAAHALESPTSPDAPALASAAVAELATQNQLAQVLDLAERYGADALGDRGFAISYVRGILAFQAAREAHPTDNPTITPRLVAMYETAAEHLNRALASEDHVLFPRAAAACTKLLGQCRYFQSRFTDAIDLFNASATGEYESALPRDEAVDARWMAIVCLDRIVSTAPTPTLEARLLEMIDAFLVDYPASRYAPRLTVKRAVLDTTDPRSTIDDLLNIPPNSDVYPAARTHAAQLLFRAFRQASAADRPELGANFLRVVRPQLSAASDQIAAGQSSAVEPALRHARQILEVALDDSVRDIDTAQAAFDLLDALPDSAQHRLDEHRTEITYRRLQERMNAGDPAAASALAERLWTDRPEDTAGDADRWATLAIRSMFQYGFDVRRAPAMENSRRVRTAADAIVIKFGPRTLDSLAAEGLPADHPAVLAYAASLASALRHVADDADAHRRALERYTALLEQRPRNEDFLRAAAELAAELDQPTLALQHYRTLVAGLSAGSTTWFQARTKQLHLIAQLDPDRARSILDQHRALYDDYGPEPFGPELRALHESLLSEASIPAEDAP